MNTHTVVIGAGPGGYVCAIRLAQAGFSVTIVEKDSPGGTCLNVGCIPSKALIRAGRLAREAKEGASLGIVIDKVEVNLDGLKGWKDKVVGQVTRGVKELLRLNKVTLIQGKAKVIRPGLTEVELSDGGVERIESEEIVLATGSRPIELRSFPFDGEKVWSSKEALSPPFLPGRLLVVGGGYIGLELGMVYKNFGSDVTVVEAMESVLPGLEGDLQKEMTRVLKKRRLPVLTKAMAKGFSKEGDTLLVQVEHKGEIKELPCDAILVTVGRRPWDGDACSDLELKRSKPGFIEVDNCGRTSVDGVRAIGDVAGQPMLAHKASAQAQVVADSIAGKEGVSFEPKAIPAVVFTDPEIATVGLTAAQAAEEGIKTVEGKFPMRALGRAATLGALDGFIKVVAQEDTGKIVGLHMMGPEVSELIAAGALAVEQGLTLEQLAGTIQSHPTLAEAIPEAAESIFGSAIHLFQAKKKK